MKKTITLELDVDEDFYPRRRENPYIVDAGVGTPTPAL